jgi:ribosomal protein S18 acetylase RimI-like enzyme
LTDDDGDRYQRLWDWVEERAPDEPLWYLDTLAVDPARQGEGLGKTLVQFGLAQASQAGLPAFLETATERNVAFYETLGFRVVDEGNVPGGGPRIWFMQRDSTR